MTTQMLCLFTDWQTLFTRPSEFWQNLTRTKSSTRLDRNAKKTVRDPTKATGDVQDAGDVGIVVRLVLHPSNAMSACYSVAHKQWASGCCTSKRCRYAVAYNFTECWPIFKIPYLETQFIYNKVIIEHPATS